MSTLSTRPVRTANVDWYVRKYRRECEDMSWDESRVQQYEPPSGGATTAVVLAKFATGALILTGVLGLIAAAIH